jgi:glycosyltransferase involved in cell wall biosynthesis
MGSPLPADPVDDHAFHEWDPRTTMRILVGTSSPVDKGAGINTYVKEIVAELRRRGHGVTLVGPAPEDSTFLDQHGVTLLPVDQHSDPELAVRQIVDAIDEGGIDCVINNDNPFVQSVAPAVGCVFLSVAHLGHTNIATLATHNHRWTDYVVTISNEMRSRVLQKFHVPVARAPVIYNGIHDPVAAASQKSLEGPLRVVYCGGGIKRKGSDLILSAIEKSPERWSGVELSIYGSLGEAAKSRLQAHPFVEVCGRVSRAEMLEALAAAHVFLLPSREEGCPMALIEAMAFGLAPIVSDGEGAMDVMVSSGVNGFVCPIAGWESQMLDCLELYARRRELLEQHGLLARQEYLDRYTVSTTVDRLLALTGVPTVDRAHRSTVIDVLKWHRPMLAGTVVAPPLDRVCIRLGILRRHGSVALAKPPRE